MEAARRVYTPMYVWRHSGMLVRKEGRGVGKDTGTRPWAGACVAQNPRGGNVRDAVGWE